MADTKKPTKKQLQATDDPLRLYSLEEIAKRMNLSPQFLRGELKTKRLHCRRVGRLIRFTELDILEYLANCRE